MAYFSFSLASLSHKKARLITSYEQKLEGHAPCSILLKQHSWFKVRKKV